MKTVANVPVKVEQDQTDSHSLLLRPAGTIDDIVHSWETYRELKARLLDVNDWQEIAGRKCIKKSGWRKLQTAFSISDEIIKEEKKKCDDYFACEVTVKATTTNGRFSYGVGCCSSRERRFAHPEHDVRSTAHTRAKNRAISDLLGCGEVSAEEMITSNETQANASYANKDEQVAFVETIVGRQQDNEQQSGNYSQQAITEKQKRYLISLINSQALNREERDERYVQLDGLTKYEASDLIKELSSVS